MSKPIKQITSGEVYLKDDAGLQDLSGVFKDFEFDRPKPKMVEHSTINSRMNGKYPSRQVEAMAGKATLDVFEDDFEKKLHRYNKTMTLQFRANVDAFDAGGYNLEESDVLITFITGYFRADGSSKSSSGERTEFPVAFEIHSISQGLEGETPLFEYSTINNDAKVGGENLW